MKRKRGEVTELTGQVAEVQEELKEKKTQEQKRLSKYVGCTWLFTLHYWN